MKLHHTSSALLLLAVCFVAAGGLAQSSSGQKTPAAPRISKQTRLELIHTFADEIIYIRTPFPMGTKGLTLRNGATSPNGEDLQKLLAIYGPAVKPGDVARITAVTVKDAFIRFEINGGPVRKKKWYQHIEVGSMGGTAPIAPSDSGANPRGTFVDLMFDRYVPDLTPQQIKHLLRPAFDFDAKSAEEAYLDTLPPKVRDAIKNHQVLVGMDTEMVIYAKGRPPKKDREEDGETEYEEWIYGDPPADVDFVRFVGDVVVRVETMKVTGEKVVRTEKEVEIAPKPAVAAESRPGNAPTLRRPGEELPNDSSDAPRSDSPSPQPVPAPPPPPPTGGPNLVGG